MEENSEHCPLEQIGNESRVQAGTAGGGKWLGLAPVPFLSCPAGGFDASAVGQVLAPFGRGGVVCATGAGAHQGQTSREGEKDTWWTAGTARGGTGHLGLMHTETQRGRLWTACGQRRVGSKNSQTTPATTSTTPNTPIIGRR